MTDSITRFQQALAGVERILLTTHVNPDGDAVGGTLAMRALLELAGKTAEIIMSDEVPEKYRFLVDRPPHLIAEGTLESVVAAGRFEMVVFVDASERSRVGSVLDSLGDWCVEGAIEVNIDHHLSNDRFGDIAIVDPERASAAEVVFDIGLQMGLGITPSIATQLYAGVLTDTGRFQYSNTTIEALAAASRLVEAGADPALIADRIYAQRPLMFYRLLGRLLAHLEIHHEGRTALMYLSGELIDEIYPEGGMDTEGIVDYTVQIAGVEVGAFVRQVGPDRFRASLRSHGRVNVREIAEALAGGGHDSAAGCSLEGESSEVRERLLAEIAGKLP